MTPQPLKKEKAQLEGAASKLLSLALQAGASEAEVCGTFGHRTKITLEKQDYHMATSDEGYQLGLRVLRGARQGFASCNSTDPKDLKEIATRAVEIAGFSPENPYYTIAPSENNSKEAPSELWDNGLSQLSLQTQKEWTKLMITEALKDPRLRINEGAVEIGTSLYLVQNSHGTHKLEKETQASWSLMGMAVEGDTITSFDYFQQMARKTQSVPERILSTTKAFRNELLRNLKQGPAKSYKGLVIFSPRAVIDILLSPLLYHFNGRNVLEGTTKWGPALMGTEIFKTDVTLRDRPWLSDRVGCSLFDREGTPTQERVLLEKGVLKSFLLDHYAAKALKMKSTGHAVGGPSAPPTVGTHTLCVESGGEPLSQLLRRATEQQADYLLVHRYSGQANPITGDFSGVAKGGEWWHAGERAYCVKETLISGNLFEAWGSGIFGMSKEVEVIESAEESPTIVMDGISVTGGE